MNSTFNLWPMVIGILLVVAPFIGATCYQDCNSKNSFRSARALVKVGVSAFLVLSGVGMFMLIALESYFGAVEFCLRHFVAQSDNAIYADGLALSAIFVVAVLLVALEMALLILAARTRLVLERQSIKKHTAAGDPLQVLCFFKGGKGAEGHHYTTVGIGIGSDGLIRRGFIREGEVAKLVKEHANGSQMMVPVHTTSVPLPQPKLESTLSEQ